MAGREPSESELMAADLVAELLGGEWESRDGVCAAERMHDFDVRIPGGGCLALEVTTIADSEVVSFHNVMADADWAVPQLRSDWWVALPDPDGDRPVIRIKRQKSAIVNALAALEQHGISELGRDTLDPWAQLAESTPFAVREAIGNLTLIGVTFVRSTGQRPDDVARLVFSTHGGAVRNPDQLNALVVEQVHKKHEKLAARAQASERHLFIWLTDSYPDAELAFSALRPPAAPPIPAALDVVWLARYAWPIRLWRLRPPGGWEIVETTIFCPLATKPTGTLPVDAIRACSGPSASQNLANAAGR